MSARITVTIQISNPGSTIKTVTIPKGYVFQVNDPKFQSVVVAKPKTVQIPPKGTRIVKVLAYCANQNLAYPNKASGSLTPYSFAAPFGSQSAVWGTLHAPATTIPTKIPASPPYPPPKTTLPGVTFEEVHDTLSKAYSLDDLRVMLKTRLGKDLDGIVQTNKPGRMVAFDLLVRAEREGWVRELIREAHSYNPGNPGLNDVVTRLGSG